MIKIITIIGARPQIIKAAAISRAIQKQYSNFIKEIIVHTGQHYDHNMSEVFFEELGIPTPNYHLNCGSNTHGKQTADMLVGIEEVLQKEQPNALLVYGDTNSTLAGAMAASKLMVPVIHVEAGLRSFNKSMPEELNRVLCDHVSTLLFAPTKKAIENLEREGFDVNKSVNASIDKPIVLHCGDIMLDNSLHFSEMADKKLDIGKRFGIEKDDYLLVTIHRNNNTDIPERLDAIFKALNAISIENELNLLLPLHPRTAKLLESHLSKSNFEAVKSNKKFIITEPVSFLEMIALEKNARMVMTDSGGVQKEAFYFNKPCVILRPETEWVELLECGAAELADADYDRIKASFIALNQKKNIQYPSYYGDGHAAEFICQSILKYIGSQ